MSLPYKLIETHQCYQGTQSVYSHWSDATKCMMHFGLFLPPNVSATAPVLYWLSGLTCSEQNFITKSGAQRIAAQLGIILVVPDTSPRQCSNIKQKLDNVGEGASFYLNATQDPWKQHYQMESYISEELPLFLNNQFAISHERCGIFGHSMGGHGALILGLKHPHLFHSISAFSPIASVLHSPWGVNALTHYLGNDKAIWQQYDACELLKQGTWPHGELLIDQGEDDPFITDQLKPQLLIDAAAQGNLSLKLRYHPKYDHSYYFISSFIEEHLIFHITSNQNGQTT